MSVRAQCADAGNSIEHMLLVCFYWCINLWNAIKFSTRAQLSGVWSLVSVGMQFAVLYVICSSTAVMCRATVFRKLRLSPRCNAARPRLRGRSQRGNAWGRGRGGRWFPRGAPRLPGVQGPAGLLVLFWKLYQFVAIFLNKIVQYWNC